MPVLSNKFSRCLMHTQKAIHKDDLLCMRPTRFELVTFGFGDQRSNPTELRARKMQM